MTRVLTATCFALACAVGLSAQTASPSQDKPKPEKPTASQTADKPSKPADQKTKSASAVTLTGCLAAGETPNAFTLTNVKTDTSASAGAQTGTSGTGATVDSSVRLIGAPARLNLKEHVGHAVKVTGSWAPQARSDSAGKARSLNVRNVEHVSEKCDGR